MKIKVGDQKWFVYGYDNPIASKFRVVEIDEYFDDIWIDGPIKVNHPVSKDELYDTQEEARIELLRRAKMNPRLK